uniref:Uncharacterized protein n=1 Tax=Candidatus Kentrum sp. FM TaxID=2126340 RepID=A0A450SH10_9GAMM|nr:MAG: hypothetical protein BECKFM1743C_GA0114222_1010813 [Candidatus Kentron sp. FM]
MSGKEPNNAPETTYKTDWESLAAMMDKEFDYFEIGPLPETFFERARIRRPQPQVTRKGAI